MGTRTRLAVALAMELVAGTALAADRGPSAPASLRVLVPADEMPEIQKVAFSDEVYPVRHMAITRRPGPLARRVEDLRALRVGVIPGTSWEQAVADAGVPKGRRVIFRDADAVLAGLRAGQVGAVVMTVFDFALAKRHDPELEAGVFVGKTGQAAFAVRQDDARLLEAMNGYLRGMRQARQSLMFKYLSDDALTLIAQARRE